MKLEETQFILQSMRPDGQDGRDSMCREAMDHVRASPELQRWLEAEQQFDRAMSEALNTVEPPARLMAQILAGGRASQVTPWWQSRKMGWAAAVALVLLMGALFMLDSPVQQAGESMLAYRKAMVTELESMQGLPFRNANASDVREWLALNQAKVPGMIPDGLASWPTIGCNVFDWNGQKVTLICFRPEDEVAAGAAATHLFVVDAAEVPDLLTPSSGPQYASVEEWSTVAWESGGQVYLMVTRNPPETLEKLVPNAG